MSITLKNSFKNWLRALLLPIPLVGLFYLPRYFSHLYRYSRKLSSRQLFFKDLYPCLYDQTVETPFDSHYFYQSAWLSRELKKLNPSRHVDIGSSVMMVGVLSAQVDTLFLDFRPLAVDLPGLTSMAGTILDLPFPSQSVPSVSCLHVLEHIGLGRYGDPLDAFGSEKAASELQRIVANEGSLFLSVPVGRQRTCFNAHRVFYPQTITTFFSELELISFSYVDDDGNFYVDQPLDLASSLEYGCGMFHFKKHI